MRASLVSHPSGDQLAMVVDSYGLPIPMASEYLLTRRGLAPSTTLRNAQELLAVHRWVDRLNLDLDGLFSAALPWRKALIDTSLPDALRKKVLLRVDEKIVDIRSYRDDVAVVSDVVFMQRLNTTRDYFVFWFDEYADRFHHDEARHTKITKSKEKVIAWIDKRMIRPRSNRRGEKALTIKSTKLLIKNLSEKLEFKLDKDATTIGAISVRAYINARNYIINSLMLCFGLRPGEVLSLRVSDILIGRISQINVTRRKADPEDTRKPRPAIKANGRALPILDRKFERELDTYMFMLDMHMEQNRKTHDYLIVSDEGNPLSYALVNALYQHLQKELGAAINAHLNAKSLRHTFSTNLENTLRRAGVGEERRRKHLAYARGDSSLSSQEAYLEAAFADEFNEASKKVQGELYD